jgi:ADP-ribose pyrophosphatase YjhB (NUDIX family)
MVWWLRIERNAPRRDPSIHPFAEAVVVVQSRRGRSAHRRRVFGGGGRRVAGRRGPSLMGHPPQAVWLPGRGLAHLAPAVERTRAYHGTTPEEFAVVLRARPRGTEAGQLVATAWVLDPARHHLLLVDHRQHGWSCPGGHVETREEPAAAAVRELSEATGLRLTPDRLDPVTVSRASSPADEHGPAHDHWTLGYLFTANPTALLARERESIAWHRVDALPSRRVDDLAPLLSALLADR